MLKKVMLVFLFVSVLFAGVCQAVPTKLTVRVKAHDAKFIGTGVGDIQVVVRDFFTGKILSQGYITGGTGNTKLLMTTAIKRGTKLSDLSTASFTAILDINEPKKLLIELTGPMAAGIDIHKETKTLWLLPGKDVVEDGIIAEFYGLIVQAYSPVPHEMIPAGGTLTIGAHVSPMCGCPIGKNKLWNFKNYQVSAIVYRNGEKITEIPLQFTGKTGNFEANYNFVKPGAYKIFFTASDNQNNHGVDISTVVVLPKEKMKKMKKMIR